MATYEQAMTALRNADKAGDVESAKKLAAIAKKLKPSASTPAEFTTEAAMAQLERIEPSQRPQPQPPTSLGQTALGTGEAALSAITGAAAAPIGAAAGLYRGLTGGRYGTQAGADEAERRASEIASRFTYQPRTPSGQRQLKALGSALEPLQALDPTLTMGMSALARPALREGLGRVEGVGREVAKVPSKVKDIAATATGAKLPAAREEAVSAIQKAVKTGAAKETLLARKELTEEQVLNSERQKIDAKLEGARRSPLNLDQQGAILRDAYTSVIEKGKQSRAKTADELFTRARTLAAEKEASGQRIDTSAVESQIKELLKKAEGIPDLESKLSAMSSAIRGRPKPEVISEAPRIWLPEPDRYVPSPPAQPKGKTFEQLELARRYFNDIGYGADLEGYPAIIRSAARDAAKSIEKAMGDFVPQFDTYKATYRKMSEPLESLGTRFGKAISGTEGGMTEDAYSKVANADLPNRLFSKREGVKLLVDALSGGKGSSPKAKVAAQKTVDKMVLNWIVETSSAKSPEAALASIRSPQMRATLSEVPSVAEKMSKRFESRVRQAEKSSELSKRAEKIGRIVSERGKVSDEMRIKLKMADDLMSQKSDASKKAAFSEYRKLLLSGRKKNLIPEDKYKAALDLMDRASTLEEKTATVRKILGAIGIGAMVTKAPEMAGHL